MSFKTSFGKKIYAAYRGEQWLVDGTVQEIADFLKIPRRIIEYRCTPTAHQRFKDDVDSKALLVYFVGRESELV